MSQYSLPGHPKAHVELHIHADQIGSARQLITPEGALVKSIEYDSFGNVMHDSHPSFFFPLGFAGGLVDPFTGFTRFGYRDYDPTVGRFTAKDPLGDTGGDHDLYDYCVDDPVSRFDFTGLDSVPVRNFSTEQGHSDANISSHIQKPEQYPNDFKDIREVNPSKKTKRSNQLGLGPFRGKEPGYYNDHPVIFRHNSEAPNRAIHAAAGALTPNKGIIGTFGTMSDRQGTTRLVVYGNPETGEPSSWTLLEWGNTGKKFPDSDWPVYGWLPISTEERALARPGLFESLTEFQKSKSSKK